VVKALNIDTNKKKSGWTECSGAVSGNFRARNSPPAIELLPNLLQHIPILLFSGDKDLICNHLGTEEMIHRMTWLNGTGFEDPPGSGSWAPRRPWTFDGEPAGFYQTARNLTYVLYYNSSHMVPFDYPRRARDMLDRFVGVDIRNIGGEDSESRIDGETNRPPTSVDETTKQSEETAEEEKEKLKQATWRAYYKAGAAALVFVTIAALGLGLFVYLQRRKQGARGLRDVVMGKLGRQQIRTVRLEEGLEDENELDELVADTPMFSLSDEEEGSDDEGRKRRRSDDETAKFINGESRKGN
jgi:carboxypeptidase D